MEGKGLITSVQGTRARVKISTGAECGGCVARDHCHGGGSQEREITVINTYGAEPGDFVMFEAQPSRVALSALLVWIVPVLAMIVGYMIAERLSGGFIPILMAFVFLVLAFAVLKVVDNAVSGGTSFYPAITGLADAESLTVECPDKNTVA